MFSDSVYCVELSHSSFSTEMFSFLISIISVFFFSFFPGDSNQNGRTGSLDSDGTFNSYRYVMNT